MSSNIYKPKNCSYHQRQPIFNFCKNAECFLPLCPSCIKIHADEHNAEKSFPQFENIQKVVADVDGFFEKTIQQMKNHQETINDQKQQRKKQEADLRKTISQAKIKMVTLVERFFTDFQKQVDKSIICYNESMKQSYLKVQDQMEKTKLQIQEKQRCLRNDNVLKVLVGFYVNESQNKYNAQMESIKERIVYFDSQRVKVLCQSASSQKVIAQLGNYIHLSFQNWQNEIRYVSEFIKQGVIPPNNSKMPKTQNK